jgi:hypothetical protein
MVEKYLRKYMFQDDVYDSFESTYREVFSDATSGQYPSALADTASFAMGRTKDVQQALKIRTSTDKVLFSKISVIQDMLLNRYGISKAVSRPILFVFGILVPLFSLFFLATTFALNQKVMTERMAIKRYGESILSAEEKPEDDEEEEEDNDDDDEEDEDDQEGGNKVSFLRDYYFSDHILLFIFFLAMSWKRTAVKTIRNKSVVLPTSQQVQTNPQTSTVHSCTTNTCDFRLQRFYRPIQSPCLVILELARTSISNIENERDNLWISNHMCPFLVEILVYRGVYTSP